MPELVLGFRAARHSRTHEARIATDGSEASHLHGQPLDDAGRPARARRDAAVLHDEVRQRREPQPPLRLGGRRGGRLRARADREAHRRQGQQGDRLHAAARPRATTSRIKGVAEFYKDKGNHIITTVTEHKAVLDTCKRLEKAGLRGHLPRRRQGRPRRPRRRQARPSPTRRSSSAIMLANNEIGTVQPLEEIGKITRERGVLLHSDAVQGVGKVDVRRAEDERRPRVAHGAQDLRPQGRRRALRAAQQAARAHRRADRRRRARARDALGHAERAAASSASARRARSCAARARRRARRSLALRERLRDAHHERGSTRSTSTARSSTASRATSTSASTSSRARR